MPDDNSPMISIIMAAYNADKFIKQSIESVLQQTYNKWELIIVDDCSTDKTATIAQSYTCDNRIIFLRNDSNQGVSFSRDRALQNARGEYIAILDSDDQWIATKLEKQMNRMKDASVDLVYTGSAFVDENGKPIDWVLHVPETMSYKKLLKQNLISNSSVLIKKELYLKYYSKGDEMHEDFACWIKMIAYGHRAIGIDEPMLIYRISSSSKSGKKTHAAKMNWNTYRYCGLNFFSSIYYMIWYTYNGVKKYRSIHAAMQEVN